MVIVSAMVDFANTPRISRLRGALIVAMVGILLTAYSVNFIWQDRGYPSEVTTTGTLTDSYPHVGAKRGGTVYEFHYATPDGRQFTGTYLVPNGPDGASLDRDGDTVKVVYSPDDPAKGRLWVNRGSPVFLTVAAGIAIILGGLGVVIRELLERRHRRQAIRSQAGSATV
jgi:hypothetical protein